MIPQERRHSFSALGSRMREFDLAFEAAGHQLELFEFHRERGGNWDVTIGVSPDGGLLIEAMGMAPTIDVAFDRAHSAFLEKLAKRFPFPAEEPTQPSGTTPIAALEQLAPPKRSWWRRFLLWIGEVR